MFSFCFDWRSRAAKTLPVEVYNEVSSGQVAERKKNSEQALITVINMHP